MLDTDSTQIAAQDLASEALRNLTLASDEQYAIRYGCVPARDFPPQMTDGADLGTQLNIWEEAFPALFPFGEGGLERRRPVWLSLQEHVRWALQHCSRRFRTHPTFAFMAFGILQRRQALTSAGIQIRRSQFQRIGPELCHITVHDLQLAAEQERRKQPITNSGVHELRKHAHITATKVMGSNASRATIRSEIWSTVAMLNAPSIWLTINPDDLHDPIAQVFVGEHIDLDSFESHLGPDSTVRARNIADDPCGAAEFFHFIVQIVFETLFQVRYMLGKGATAN